MSAFSETTLETKLTELNPSQQSIQTLSLWLIHHRKHAKKIVTTWKKLLVQSKLWLIVIVSRNSYILRPKNIFVIFNDALFVYDKGTILYLH